MKAVVAWLKICDARHKISPVQAISHARSQKELLIYTAPRLNKTVTGGHNDG